LATKEKSEESRNYESETGQKGTGTPQKYRENGKSGTARAASEDSPKNQSENSPIKPPPTTTTGRDGKQYSRPKRTTGKEFFDDRKVKDLIGKLIRLFDARMHVYGKSPFHQNCLDAMSKVITRFEQSQVGVVSPEKK